MKKKILCFIMVLALVVSYVPSVFAERVHNIYDIVYFADYDASSISTVGITPEGAVKDLKSANLMFKDVNFGNESPIKAEVVAGCGGTQQVKLQFRLDSPSGQQLFEIQLENTGWADYTYEIFLDDVKVTGKHDLYVVNAMNGTGNLMSFKFTKPPEKVAAFPEYPAKDYYSDIADNKYREKINLVGALGLIDGYDVNEYNPELGVTRGEFARAIYKLISEEREEVISEQPFDDVFTDEVFAEAVHYLKDKGIITGRDDNTYKPYDFITVEDAVVMICRMLGYEPIANVGGGYVDGYLAIAAEEGILKGVDRDGRLQRDSFAQLIYNAVHADYMSLESVSLTNGLNYNKVAGILSDTKDIYYSEIYIDETSYTGIFSPVSSLPENSIRSGNVIYNTGESGAEAFLGMTCKCYWQDVDGERNIIYITPKRTDGVYYASTLDGNEIEIDGNQITVYETNQKTKVKNISNFVVIYNGKSIETPLSTIVTTPFKGSVRIVEGEKTPIVFIEQYDNIVLGTIDKTYKKFYNRISQSYINADDTHLSISLNGSPVSIDRLTPEMSGSIYQSKNTNGKKVIRILLNDTPINATVTKLSDEEIGLDGVMYKKASSVSSTIQMGTNAMFYLNEYGEIIYVDITGSNGFEIGIYLEYKYLTDEDERFIIKLVDKTGEIVKLDCYESVTADGVRIKDLAALKDGTNKDGTSTDFDGLDNVARGSVILYKVNSKNLITAIDTYNEGTGKSNDSLSRKNSTAEGCYYNNYGSILTVDNHAKYPISKNAVVIKSMPEVGEDKYEFSDITTVSSSSKMNMFIYSTIQDTFMNDIIVIDNAGTLAKWKNPIIFESADKAIDDNGEVGYVISGYGNDGYTEYFATADDISKNSKLAGFISNVGCGDWVRFKTGSNGEIIDLELIYRKSGSNDSYFTTTDTSITTTPKLNSNVAVYGYQDATGRFIVGTVVDIEGDYVKVRVQNGASETDTFDEYINVSEGVIAQWGVSSRGVLFTKGLGKESILIGSKVYVYGLSRRNVQVLVNSL